MAYSLNGENVHYGTPLNPVAPGRIPGGSGGAQSVMLGLRCARNPKGAAYDDVSRMHAIAQSRDARAFRAVVAAEERAVLLEPMTHDADAADLAGRGKRMDRAFETVERVRLPIADDLEGFVVVVAAGFTGCHGFTSRRMPSSII
jgi:hypothetical protein